MISGNIMGWSSPTLPRLKQPDSFLIITEDEASWIGSLLALGALIGPFSGGFLADKIGRRWTLLSLTFPFILSWTLILVAQSVAMIYAARVIAGFALGAQSCVVPMYVGEIAEDSIRGALGSVFSTFLSVGFFYSYVIGAFVSYNWFGVASIILPCVFAITFFFMPDSPYYLLSKGNTKEANKALQWLRKKTIDGVHTELEQMQKYVEESGKDLNSVKELFTTRGNIKAICLACGLMAFIQLSGINAVLFYSTEIFQEAGGSLTSDISTIIIGAMLMISASTAPFIVERLGRRKLLFISATGMSITQIILGSYFYLKTKTDTDLSAVRWLPLLCLVVYFPFFLIGLGPIPLAVMGEIFPSNVKGFALATTSSFYWLIGFLVIKFFLKIVVTLGAHAAFWLFAGCCIIADIFVYFLLPETKGKSLQDIQDILNKSTSRPTEMHC